MTRVTRIIDHRSDARPDEEIFELRIFERPDGEVRASVFPLDAGLDYAMINEISAPASEAFIEAVALCERENVGALWVHDPLGLFPAHRWPVRDIQ